MRHLVRLARKGAIEPLSFQEEGVLDRFPSLTHAQCMEAMHLVWPDGRVMRGMEAAVRAVATRGWTWLFVWPYYVPGVRQLLDALYRWIARNRYRFAGKDECTDGTCAAHG